MNIKILFSITIIIYFFICCSQLNENIKEFTKLEKFIIEFKKRNPNTFNNEITREKSNKLFKKEITNFYKSYDSSFFFNPIKYSETIEKRNKIYGLFKLTSEYINEENLQDYEKKMIYVKVVMEIPRSQIDTLEEGKYYQVVGKFIKYEPPFYPSSIIEPWEPFLMKPGSNEEYYLGDLYIKTISIRSIDWRERMKLKGKIRE